HVTAESRDPQTSVRRETNSEARPREFWKGIMSLEVAIEKQVAGFRLAVEFTADGVPLGLLGSSGSGKTMTLRAIAGLDSPNRGRIVLHGRVLFDSEKRINLPARER